MPVRHHHQLAQFAANDSSWHGTIGRRFRWARNEAIGRIWIKHPLHIWGGIMHFPHPPRRLHARKDLLCMRAYAVNLSGSDLRQYADATTCGAVDNDFEIVSLKAWRLDIINLLLSWWHRSDAKELEFQWGLPSTNRQLYWPVSHRAHQSQAYWAWIQLT